MDDELCQLMNKVMLGHDGDSDDVVLDETWVYDSQKGVGLCLLGEMVMKKPINQEATKYVLCKVWQLSKAVDIQEVGERTWLFQFGCLKDKLKVLYRQPWSFNRAFTIFRDFDRKSPIAKYDFCWGIFWPQLLNVHFKYMNEQLLNNWGIFVGRSLKVRAQINVSTLLKHVC